MDECWFDVIWTVAGPSVCPSVPRSGFAPRTFDIAHKMISAKTKLVAREIEFQSRF